MQQLRGIGLYWATLYYYGVLLQWLRQLTRDSSSSSSTAHVGCRDLLRVVLLMNLMNDPTNPRHRMLLAIART